MRKNRKEVKVNLVEMTRQTIENMMLGGALQPGQRVVEHDLANQIGISRTPLREALRQLESKGFLKKRNGAGYIVAHYSFEDVRNRLEVRLALETAAIELACKNATENQLERAAMFLARIDEEWFNVDKDFFTINKLINSDQDWNSLFHKEMYNAAGNDLLTKYISDLRDLDRLKQISLNLTSAELKTFQSQHYRILDAVKQRNKSKAKRAVQAHMKTLYNLFFHL